jgi:hypothetical protein
MTPIFSTFLNSLTALVLCMAAGFAGYKGRVFDDRLVGGLTTLLIALTLPCTIFASMLRPFSRVLLAESAATFFLAGAVFLAGGALAVLLARLLKADPGERRVWQFGLIFANVGYMGFPVCYAIFGEAGMMYVSMANAAFNVLLFTVGVKMFCGKRAERDKPAWRVILLSPAIVAVGLGFVCFVTGLRPPKPAIDAVGMLGGMTAPISMLLVGCILAKGRLRDVVNDWRVYPLMVARLLVIPLAAYAVLRLFVPNPVMLQVLVVLAAMPVAAISAIFAEKYQQDTALAGRLVVLSTGLCVVSVPLVLWVIGVG